MSINAGAIVTVAGRTVLQRVQNAGLGNVNIPIDTIREVGNELVVDKVPQEPDFTFTLTSLDVSCDVEAILHGAVAAVGSAGNLAGAASQDPDGTEYPWETCQAITIPSPWKDHATGSAGVVAGGHLIPGYYPTRIRYDFGATANAQTTVELGGGSFFYGKFAPTEDFFAGDGATTDFVTSEAAVRYRKGGADGTTFKTVLGVLVNGVPQVEGSDYTVVGGGPASGATPATVTFIIAPPTGASVRLAYFTTAAHAYPQGVHRDSVTLPGAVRGRNVCASIVPAGGPDWIRLGNVQSGFVEGTYATTVERELCNEEPVGRSIDGVDTTGSLTIRARDIPGFFQLLAQITGLDTDEEVVGYLNLNAVQLKIEIQNPKNPAEVLKTIYVADAQFDIPGTPAQVNTPTDFAMTFSAHSGTHKVVKGAMA